MLDHPARAVCGRPVVPKRARHRYRHGAAFVLAALLLAACGKIIRIVRLEAYLTPELVSSSLSFNAIAASGQHTCGIATDGATYCWGSNEYGQLGTSASMESCAVVSGEEEEEEQEFPCSGTPRMVTGAPRFVSIAAGMRHTCGLTAEGTAYCWGFGLGGQLGDGARINRALPAPVAGDLSFELLRIGADGALTCGITKDSHTWCWGANSNGQLGNGTQSSTHSVPLRITTDVLKFVAIDLGQLHGCGLTREGRALCWGNNWYGNLGVGSSGADGGLAESLRPVAVVTPVRFRSIAAGSNRTCALTQEGLAYCWGIDIATGGTNASTTPEIAAGRRTFRSLHAGFLHTCGLTPAGEIYCWGQNTMGELGDGTTRQRELPVRVKSSTAFTALADRPHCAIAIGGKAYCWGSNPFGQAGKRGHTVRPSPNVIVAPI